jgi:hypothetical protein
MDIKDFKKQVSVVIQGPLDDRTYEAIDCYQDFGEVIVSTWSSGEDYSLLYRKRKDSKFILATSEYPKDMSKVINTGAIFYIAQTLMRGSFAASLPYVMKVRTDELYPNLDNLIKNLIQYPDRLHTTDNGFWKRHSFCLSGHIFIDSTQNTTQATRLILDYCFSRNFNNLPQSLVCEQILGLFFMLVRNNNFELDKWKEVFRKNVFITPCVELPGHLHSGQSSAGRGFKRSEEPYPCGRKEMPNGCHNPKELYQHIEEII